MTDTTDETAEEEHIERRMAILQERLYYEAFCEGAMAAMVYSERFESSGQLGGWIHDHYNRWRDGLGERHESSSDYSDNRS